MLAKDDVVSVFRHVLHRDPDVGSLQSLMQCSSLDELLRIVVNSAEAKAQRAFHPCMAFNAQIDAEGIIRSHEDRDRSAVTDRYVSFFGVKIDPIFVPSMLRGREGSVEGPPIPTNWHADVAEFGAALRAVDLARDSFLVIELGCGWGCWLTLTGAAARRRGLRTHLVGVEGDERHVAFARQALGENGFADASELHRAVVGAKPGSAIFPRQASEETSWGLEPIFDADAQTLARARSSSEHVVLPILTIEDILPPGRVADLLHMDIQGGEADFIESCIDDLDRRVAYMVVGTHSRQVEGRLFDVMLGHGWQLEIERPMIIRYTDLKPVSGIDGVQGWRNTRIR